MKQDITQIDCLLSLTGFSLVGGPAYNDSSAAEDVLRKLDVNYIAAHALEFQSIEQWKSNEGGLGPVETTMLVALPEIDGASRWAVFRHIELPKMKKVLTIAILLRFMDSFMIYTEPFVLTGGGPGNATAFLSIDLVKMALGQFDLGPAAAMSLIYFFIVLLVCWVFYNLMMRNEGQS